MESRLMYCNVLSYRAEYLNEIQFLEFSSKKSRWIKLVTPIGETKLPPPINWNQLNRLLFLRSQDDSNRDASKTFVRNQCALLPQPHHPIIFFMFKSSTFFRIYQCFIIPQKSPQPHPSKTLCEMIEVLITFIFPVFFFHRKIRFPRRRFKTYAGCFILCLCFCFRHRITKYLWFCFFPISWFDFYVVLFINWI